MSDPSSRLRALLGGLVERTRLAVHYAGFDVKRETVKRRFVPALHAHGVDTVLDVGANTGQFASDLRRAGFRGRILSVEPLSEACSALAVATRADPHWEFERAALSDRPGTITVNVAGNSVSSSVLPMGPLHADAAPESHYAGREEVPSTTVDELVDRHGVDPSTALLKIDVQGYERTVLEGAVATLDKFAAVRVETSLVALYVGQSLMPELLELLIAHGLELWFVEPGFVDPASGRLLQLDATFFRSRPA